jgi:hypothetical protein
VPMQPASSSVAEAVPCIVQLHCSPTFSTTWVSTSHWMYEAALVKKNNVSNSLEAEVVNRVGAGPAQLLGPLHGPIKLCYLDYFRLQGFLGQSQWGFMSVSSILNAVPHQRNFTFCMKPLGKRRKEFHHGESFVHSFTCVGNCVKPPLRHK